MRRIASPGSREAKWAKAGGLSCSWAKGTRYPTHGPKEWAAKAKHLLINKLTGLIPFRVCWATLVTWHHVIVSFSFTGEKKQGSEAVSRTPENEIFKGKELPEVQNTHIHPMDYGCPAECWIWMEELRERFLCFSHRICCSATALQNFQILGFLFHHVASWRAF